MERHRGQGVGGESFGLRYEASENNPLEREGLSHHLLLGSCRKTSGRSSCQSRPALIPANPS